MRGRKHSLFENLEINRSSPVDDSCHLWALNRVGPIREKGGIADIVNYRPYVGKNHSIAVRKVRGGGVQACDVDNVRWVTLKGPTWETPAINMAAIWQTIVHKPNAIKDADFEWRKQ